MAKKVKNQSKYISSLVSERNIMILLALVLLISVSVLIFKDTRPTNILEPVTIQQTSTQ